MTCLVQEMKIKRRHEFGVATAIIRRLWLLIIVAGIMSACQEKFESRYPSATAADKAGAFDHGRIPDLLKPDVTDIREWYDIASSEVRGRFALNPGVLNRLKSSCTPATDVPRRTRSMPGWFPVSITSGDAAAQGMSVFRCTDFFVATDKSAAAGYFWETNYPRSAK
jgi:hypothetical protein